MTDLQRRELMELWLTAGEGAADQAQLRRLSQWLETDADARSCVLEIAAQQGWLAWNAAEVHLSGALSTLAAAPSADLVSPCSPAGFADDADRRTEVATIRPPAAAPVAWGTALARASWAALAASLVGFVLGYWTNGEPASSGDARLSIAASHPPAADPSSAIHATMVSSTGCVWGPGNVGRSRIEARLAGGDSLQLLEGIAEFQIAAAHADVRLQLEGPVAVVLTAQGTLSINYGKAIVRTGVSPGLVYPIETPFGRVLLESDAEVGLMGFGSAAEIHCFRGRAAVESPWLTASAACPTGSCLTAGQALQFDDAGGGMLQSRGGTADAQRFAPQVSMSTDFLAVDAGYVREIVAAKPVAYWRFERATDGVIRNEMGPQFQCRIKGEVGFAGPPGSQSLELGLGSQPGSIVADEFWDDVLRDGFTIEFWMKPSHHHLGSILSFVGEFDLVHKRNTHGILVEINGPTGPAFLRNNRLRFLHRPKLSFESNNGVDCFSQTPYEIRRWQHVAAVKDGPQLRLYLDGELVQSARNQEPTPRRLQLVLGQLYTEKVERFYVGQLDEIAIYDRPLADGEVRRHRRLLRPLGAEQETEPDRRRQDAPSGNDVASEAWRRMPTWPVQLDS